MNSRIDEPILPGTRKAQKSGKGAHSSPLRASLFPSRRYTNSTFDAYIGVRAHAHKSGAALRGHVRPAHRGQFQENCPACVELRNKMDGTGSVRFGTSPASASAQGNATTDILLLGNQ